MTTIARPEARGELELRQVTKQYGKDRVVDSVSARIAPGEFFSLLGPSGSGKTTTLMMIAGFTDLDEGVILVDGMNVSDVPPQRRGFGMVFQNYAIFPHLNVFENIAFPLRARKLPAGLIKARVNEALELVRLEKYADRFSRQLSGGQQQRVAIARAVVFHPNVVLMDEPLGALDKNLRYQMQVEIKEIQQRLGMTVVYVTHDQEEAMNMSDRIAIMNSGRVEQVGRPEDIYNSPQSRFIARFLGEANLVEGTIDTIADGLATLTTAEGLQLRAPVNGTLEVGAKASLFVRPERVGFGWPVEPAASRPGTAGADSPMNHATGQVAQTSFLGNILRHSVVVGPTQRMLVDVQNSSGGRPPTAAGGTAHLSWRVSDSVILQR